jgi:hypothetical protein
MKNGGKLFMCNFYRNYIENSVTIDNYYIFIYFIMKFQNCAYLPYIENEIIKKLDIESLQIGSMAEQVFEIKYNHFVLLNALTQSLDVNYRPFFNYVLKLEKKIPSALISKILQKEDIGLIKEMLGKKIAIFDIETDAGNMFERNNYQHSTFQRIDQVSDTTRITGKNNYFMPKHVIYYLYKSPYINKHKRDYFLQELSCVLNLDDGEILSSIIKMKDQDLTEYI